MSELPPFAIEESWIAPVDMGGHRANYPIVSCLQQYGLFHEVNVDWQQTIVGFENIAWPRFDGDVWTIQLTARPGYYVESEELAQYGFMDHETPPFG